MPVAKKIARVVGGENYNILQNNGRLAHQEVDHVRDNMLGAGCVQRCALANMDRSISM